MAVLVKAEKSRSKVGFMFWALFSVQVSVQRSLLRRSNGN
jgi:hypothetical protein